MGRQDSVIQLTGSVGNLSFYKSKDGYLARKKSGVTAERVKSDPKFARTRENMAEFTRSGQATKLLRTAFRSLLENMADGRVTGRLTREMMRVIQADQVNLRGQRNVNDGEAALMEGFEFNESGKLLKTFFAPFTATVDRAAGILLVDIPAFVPANMISWPEGATHIRLKAGGAAIDFAAASYAVTTSESAEIALGQQLQEALQLSHAVPAASASPLFLVFGIEFLQFVNGVQYPLKNGTFNAMAIVKADGGAPA